MKMVVEESIAMNAFRAFFSIIDNFIYGMIASCYEFIDAIAGARIADGAVDAISDRVYAFLSIFMLFKVSFSFINYLINPDSFTDKNNGAQKIVLNIVVMFLMLIVNPWVFDKIYEVQDLFLKEGIVENIIFGTTNVDGENQKTFQMSSDCGNDFAVIDINRYKGDYVSLLLFKPFYQSIDIDDIKEDYCRTDSDGELHVSDYLKSSVYNAEDDTYLVSYVFLASTAVGVVALLILLSMLLDVALRAVKLMFLQIISPIPIISYIDPKSGKDGIFKKWLKEVGSTWISLFVRLFCFNFSILLIQLMTTGQILGIKEDYAGKMFVDLILIIGALMFVKKLPDIISNIFGIKSNGGFNINPLKKISNEALGGKAIIGVGKGATGFVRGAVGGGIAGGVAGKEAGAFGRGVVMGAVGGAYHGARNSKGAFTKNMKEQYKTLTGNEMARLSPSRLFLYKTGEKKVKEVGSDIGRSYGVLNTLQSKLSALETVSGQAANQLHKRGYDVNNLSKEKVELAQKIKDTKLAKTEADNRYKEVTSKAAANLKDIKEQKMNIQNKRQKYEEAKKIISSAPSGLIFDQNNKPIRSQEYKDAELFIKDFEINQEKENQRFNELNLREKEINEMVEAERNNSSKKQHELNLLMQDEKNIKEYETSLGEQDKLRKDISTVNLAIDTMKKEKSQRATFFQYDEADKKTYSSGLANVEDVAKKNNISFGRNATVDTQNNTNVNNHSNINS